MTKKVNYEKRIKTLERMFGKKYLSELFKHIYSSYDALMRLEGGQVDNFFAHMNRESERTNMFYNGNTLANDTLGYDCIRVLAVLNHPCQLCAEDPEAWHTRAAFCSHKTVVQHHV